MAFQIEQRQRPQHTSVAHRRRQLDRPLMPLACDQRQRDVERNRAAIALLEALAKRFE